MIRPKVSIVVPVYNVKSFLEDCLESICRQTYTNFEVLIVDDGSTDGSGDICDRYAEKDPRFKVWHIVNGGPAVARNVGLDNVSGDYVCFLDSDDELCPNCLATLVEHVSRNSYDILIFGMTFLLEGQIIKKRQPPRTGLLSKRESVAAVYSLKPWSGCRGAGGYAPNKMFAYELVKKLRFDEDRHICEDELFSIKAIESARSIYFVDEGLYLYKQRPTGLSKQASFAQMLVRGREKILDQVKDPEIKELTGAALILALIRAYKTDTASRKEICRKVRSLRQYRKILSLRRRVWFFLMSWYAIL